jgi:hypothetical protein
MGSASDYLEAKILDHMIGSAYSAPATWYVAASTADPTDDASGIAEPSGNNYARASVAANTFSRATSTIDNDSAITFNEATGSWGTLTHWAIYDAVTDGNMLFHGSLASSQAIASSETLRFPAGELDITCD